MSDDRHDRDEVMKAILERMANNGQSLREICRDPGMPAYSTVYRWVRSNEAIRLAYARAREELAWFLFEEIIETANEQDTVVTKTITKTGAGGTEIIFEERDAVERRRLKIDALKWRACKMLPKRFGHQRAVAVRAERDGPSPHGVREVKHLPSGK